VIAGPRRSRLLALKRERDVKEKSGRRRLRAMWM
jgi:hypothetical protein